MKSRGHRPSTNGGRGQSLPVYPCSETGGPWATDAPCLQRACRLNLAEDRCGVPYLFPADTCALRALENIERDESWRAPYRALASVMTSSEETMRRLVLGALVRFAARMGVSVRDAETQLRALGVDHLLSTRMDRAA